MLHIQLNDIDIAGIDFEGETFSNGLVQIQKSYFKEIPPHLGEFEISSVSP